MQPSVLHCRVCTVSVQICFLFVDIYYMYVCCRYVCVLFSFIWEYLQQELRSVVVYRSARPEKT